MTSFIGIKLDSGNNVRKNQKIEKETNLYFENRRFAENRMNIKNKKLISTGNSKMLFEMG